MVVPRLHVKAAVAAHGMPQLATIRWVGLRCRVTVDSGQPGMSVDIRLRTADPSSSLVEGRRPRPVSSDGTVSLPVADPNDSGAAAAVVLLDREGRVIHFIATVLGQSENGGRA
jgi:hypothetical protein